MHWSLQFLCCDKEGILILFFFPPYSLIQMLRNLGECGWGHTSLSSTAKQNESADIESMKTSLALYENKVEEIRSEWKEAQQKVAILEREMTSKDNVIKKLKDRVNMLTVPVGSAEELRQSLPPSGGQIHPAHLQETEVEIERLRGQLENAGGGAEIVGELEAENEQLHKTVKELKEDLAKLQGKSEEMMNHLVNVIEQTKTFRMSLIVKDSETKRLQVSECDHFSHFIMRCTCTDMTTIAYHTEIPFIVNTLPSMSSESSQYAGKINWVLCNPN